MHTYTYIHTQTASSVYANKVKAEKAMMVNGWGLYELQCLWTEMQAMGSRCYDPAYPSTAAHKRLQKRVMALVPHASYRASRGVPHREP